MKVTDSPERIEISTVPPQHCDYGVCRETSNLVRCDDKNCCDGEYWFCSKHSINTRNKK